MLSLRSQTPPPHPLMHAGLKNASKPLKSCLKTSEGWGKLLPQIGPWNFTFGVKILPLPLRLNYTLGLKNVLTNALGGPKIPQINLVLTSIWPRFHIVLGLASTSTQPRFNLEGITGQPWSPPAGLQSPQCRGSSCRIGQEERWEWTGGAGNWGFGLLVSPVWRLKC